jgi:hypothetical protein
MTNGIEDRAVDSRDAREVADGGSDRARRSIWILSGILILATGLRLYGLFFNDTATTEIYTVRDAQAFGDHISYLRPFYYFLQHLLLELSSPTPLFLRLPPFVFGVLGVWLTAELGRRAFGTTAGLVSAFLVAISPWHLYASQYARYWTLVYALAALVYIALPRAVDIDRPAAYVLALLTIVVGALTHPSFVFPMVGVVLAVVVVSKEGQFRWPWPSRQAWLYLWGPLGLMALGGLVFLKLPGTTAGLPGSRGWAAALRLLPAMVQWAGPVVVAAAVVSGASHLGGAGARDRRWGAIATFGCLSGLGLLFAASFRTIAYADYGMAMLPLVYVTVGGGVQRAAEAMSPGVRGFAIAATLTLAAGVSPGTVSHLLDGTRFDYRPAYAHIQSTGGDRLIVGWPAVIQRYYAADLRFERLRMNPSYLSQILKRSSGFWLVGSYRRYGMVRDNGEVARWVDDHCRKTLQTERIRLDYRTYRVELHWCGPEAQPQPLDR